MANPKNGKVETKDGQQRVVLAFGEVTGHAHAFYGDDVLDRVEFNGKEIAVKARSELTHEEHGTQVINPGVGEVTIQREYQMGKLARQVD